MHVSYNARGCLFPRVIGTCESTPLVAISSSTRSRRLALRSRAPATERRAVDVLHLSNHSEWLHIEGSWLACACASTRVKPLALVRGEGGWVSKMETAWLFSLEQKWPQAV